MRIFSQRPYFTIFIATLEILAAFNGCSSITGSAPANSDTTAASSLESAGSLTVVPPSQSVAINAQIPIFASGGTPPYTYTLAGSGSMNGSVFIAPDSAATATVIITDHVGQSVTELLNVVDSGSSSPTNTISATGMFAPFILNAGSSVTYAGATLTMQTDGNLVVYEGGTGVWAASWSSSLDGAPVAGRSCATTCQASFQSDGNLVLYGPSGTAYWRSSTAGNPGAQLVLTPWYPYLQIITSSGVTIWY